MRFYVLSDMADTILGMRMAGMAGELIEDRAALHTALDRLGQDPELAVIVVTAGVIRLAPELITVWKLKRHQPLIVEIPDRVNSEDLSENIAQYIVNTIGIRL